MRDDVDIKIALSNLTRKVEALALGQTSNFSNAKNEICGICVNPSHAPQPCYSLPNQQDFFVEQVNALNFHEKSPNSPYSSTYNPNWRNHPNFSWSNNTNVQQPPPSFQSQEKKPNLEEVFAQFVQKTNAFIDDTKANFRNQGASIRIIEHQVRNIPKILTEMTQGALPSNTKTNPRKHANAISLRNGKELESPKQVG